MVHSKGPYRPDPATAALLKLMQEAEVPAMSELGAEGAREFMRAAASNDIDPPEIGETIDRVLPGPAGDIPIRIHRPATSSATPGPVLLYFHGGGFVVGDLDTHERICKMLVHHGNVTCINVDYRLAPEHRYPAAVDDAIASLQWLCSNADELNVDPNRIAVGGDSAGGNLAAILAQHARAKNITLSAQLLLYPVVDFVNEYPSQLEHANTPPISKPVLDWFWEEYFGKTVYGDEDTMRNLHVSPMLNDNFENLAPAFVLTAGLDPLRDEGAAYAEKLASAGVETVYQCAMGVLHGFLRSGKLVPATRDALIAAGNFLHIRMHT